jgi:transcriptional regulator with XRE-family HTH domain
MIDTLDTVRGSLNPYIGAVLRGLRVEKGLTQEQVAERTREAKVSLETLGRIEKGTTPITVAHLEALEEVYGVDVATVFRRAMELRDRSER